MSLLLDALKQAALEKKRQDMLAAERALNESPQESSEVIPKKENSPFDFQQSNNITQSEKGVDADETLGFASENDAPPQETSASTLELQQKTRDGKEIEDKEIKKVLESPDKIEENSLSDDVHLETNIKDVNDFDFGHIELFEEGDQGGDVAEEESSKEATLSIQNDEPVLLESTDRKSDEITISEEQEKNVALLIEKSNQVYNKTRWRFYACYIGLGIVVVSIWSYQYFTLPILGHASAVNIDEQYPNIIDSETLYSMARNSAIAKPVNDPVSDDVQQPLTNEVIEELSVDIAASIPPSIENKIQTTKSSTAENIQEKNELKISEEKSQSIDQPDEKIVFEKNEDERINEESSVETQPIMVQREPPSTLSKDLNLAFSQYQAGKLSEAKVMYEKIVAKYPYQKDAFLGLAVIAARTNKTNEALNYYQQVLTIDPDNQYAKTGLLSLQTAAIENPQWLAQLDELLFQNPESPHLHFLKANVFAMRQQWRAAQESYFKAWEKSPNNPDYTFNLAVSLDQLQQTRQALEFYQNTQILMQSSPHNINEDVLNLRIKQLKEFQ